MDFQLQHQLFQWIFRTESLGWTGWIPLQGTFQSLLQHLSTKVSILWHSAFFIVQLSHPYMTTGKTIALTRRTFVGKVMSLLFNMLSRLVIAFLPRRKFLISWMESLSEEFLEPPQKIKFLSFHCFPINLPWSDGDGCHDVSFLNVEFWANFFTLFFHVHQEVSLVLICFLP